MRLRPGSVGVLGTTLSTLRAAVELPRLPRAPRRFYGAAVRTAIRTGDGQAVRWSLPPRDLAALLELAAGRPRIVELGTAYGWTALSLAIRHPQATVLTLDPTVRPTRERYLGLAPLDALSRVTFVQRGGEEPPEPVDVDLLFVDTSHVYEVVLGSFRQWMPRVVPGGLVVLDDFDHPAFPGPARAVRELGIEGERRRRLLVWTKP